MITAGPVLRRLIGMRRFVLLALLIQVAACAGPTKYHDPNMEFGSIQSVAVLPFANLSKETNAGERVRDVFINMLLSSGGVYVLPSGEVARGISRAQVADSTTLSVEEAKKLGGILGVQAVITGVVREYGEVRSGTASSNVISVSLEMMEVQTGKVVWTASSTRGGVGLIDRLLGGGGEPMNRITEKAVGDLINTLYR